MNTHAPGTRRFFIENLLAAQTMMLALDPDKVDLACWRTDNGRSVSLPPEPTCGTVACLGGWCTMNPYFQALGVTRDAFGTPLIIRDAGEGHVARFDGGEVAEYLFGESDLFLWAQPREKYPDGEDGPRVPDHQIALDRIAERLAELARRSHLP